MIREGSIEEIYDGRFYTPDDMVPVGCADCEGCSECCRSTADTIILDPQDMYLLSKGTGKVFTDMIEREIEIRLVDGLILPNLMEEHEGEEEHCLFLTDWGRCSIHAFRPGLCRLYPMGRYYTDGGFRYILQKDECTGRVKTPVLLREWLGIEDLPRYEAYIQDWHDFRKRVEKVVPMLTEKSRDSVQRYILQVFFVHPYLTRQDFYPQYEARMQVCRKALRSIL